MLDITNAASATIKGVEVESDAQLAPGWNVGGHVAWLDPRYRRYTAIDSSGASFDAAGHELSNAPNWSGRLWFERTTNLGRLGTVSGRAEARWQSTVYFAPANDPILRQTPYGLVDANVTVRLEGRPWSVGLYARNLTNTDYITAAFGTPPPAYGGRPGEPRQIGGQFNVDLIRSR